MSSKRAKQQRARIAALRAIEADQQVCERCHSERATDAHEVLNRSQGGDPTDVTGMKFLCRNCHDWIGRQPRKAVEQGFLVTRRGY